MPQRHADFAPGFTLIELMIVVAIIGILASMAVSAYQTFTIRGQVAEGVSMAAEAKAPIVDAYNNYGVAPADRRASGMPDDPTTTRGAYVSSVNVIDGRIEITFGGPRAHTAIQGDKLSLMPYETQGNTIVWRCGAAPVPAGGSLLTGSSEYVAPTIDSNYLPRVCRP